MHTTKVQVDNALNFHGLANSAASRIVHRPNHEVHTAPTADVAFQRLTRNFFWYSNSGPGDWRWAPESGANRTGKELVAGQANSTNCGGFNKSARWVAENICGIQGAVQCGTEANDIFLTLSGTNVIDRAWLGQVRTLTHDFNALRTFFFTGHSYSKYNNNLYDVTTNMVRFNQKTEQFWCSLSRAKGSNDRNGRAFSITQTYNAPHVQLPGAAPYVCVSTKSLKALRHLFPVIWTNGGTPGVTQSFINKLPDMTNQVWSTFLFVSRAHLPQPYCTTMQL